MSPKPFCSVTCNHDSKLILRLGVALQASQPVYHQIDMSLSLSSQLARKTIIEYPEFIVLLPSEAANYKLQGITPQTEANLANGHPQLQADGLQTNYAAPHLEATA